MNREKVYLVDKSNEIIGEKFRDQLVDSDCWRVISIWVTDKSGNILLQKRSMNKKVGPGIWSAACEGTIEVGDTPLETAVRELSEEIGLEVSEGDLTETTRTYYKDPQFGWRIKYGYKLVIEHTNESDFVLQQEEVAQVKWHSPRELKEFIKNNPEKFPLIATYTKLGFIS